MDDQIMYAWQVVGDYNYFVHFTCARQETAEYLRDWLQAIEEDGWRDQAVAVNLNYETLNLRLEDMCGGQQQFSTQECEVIL